LQQAPEPDKLRSLLCCNSKLSRSGACCCNVASRSQKSSGACCVAAANKQAPEPEILRSLLRCNSKQALDFLKKLRRSSGACCVAAASKLAPEPEILRSLLRCNNKQASSGVGDPPELAALQQQASSEARVATQAPELSGARSFLRMLDEEKGFKLIMQNTLVMKFRYVQKN